MSKNKNVARVGGRLILAAGEKTNHHHAISEAHATMTEESAEFFVLTVPKKPCVVRHEEHAPITLPPGLYRVRRFQREYHPENDRRVLD